MWRLQKYDTLGNLACDQLASSLWLARIQAWITPGEHIFITRVRP